MAIETNGIVVVLYSFSEERKKKKKKIKMKKSKIPLFLKQPGFLSFTIRREFFFVTHIYPCHYSNR